MSDEEVQIKAPAKRGRKPNPEKAAAKKETAKSMKNGDDGDAPPVKRGRGRPKGTGVTKKAPAKQNGTTAAPKARRGRAKKEEKKEESSEEDNKSSNNEEEEDDD